MVKLNALLNDYYMTSLFPTTFYPRRYSQNINKYEGLVLVIYKGTRPADTSTDFASPSVRASDALIEYRAVTAPGDDVTQYYAGAPLNSYIDHGTTIVINFLQGTEIKQAMSSGQATWWALWVQSAYNDPAELTLPEWNATTPFSGAVFIGDVTTTADGTGEIQYEDTRIQSGIEYVQQKFSIFKDRWISRANLGRYKQVSLGYPTVSQYGGNRHAKGSALSMEGYVTSWGMYSKYLTTTTATRIDIFSNEHLRFTPPPADVKFKRVAVAVTAYAGITESGDVMVWGFTEQPYEPYLSPTINSMGPFVDIIEYDYYSFALMKADGTVILMNEEREIPDKYISISTMGPFLYGAKLDGYIQHGVDGDTILTSSAPNIPFAKVIRSFDVYVAGGITPDGRIKVWTASSQRRSAIEYPQDAGYVKAVIGVEFCLALHENGAMVVWAGTNVTYARVFNGIRDAGVIIVDFDMVKDLPVLLTDRGELIPVNFTTLEVGAVPDLPPVSFDYRLPGAPKVLWGVAQFADTDFTGGKTNPNQDGTPYTRWNGPQDFIDTQLTNSYSGTGDMDIDLFVPFPQYAYFAYPVSQGVADIRDKATNNPGGWDGATWADGGFDSTSGPLTVTYDDGSGPEDWFVYRTSFSGIEAMSWTILAFQ